MNFLFGLHSLLGACPTVDTAESENTEVHGYTQSIARQNMEYR